MRRRGYIAVLCALLCAPACKSKSDSADPNLTGPVATWVKKLESDDEVGQALGELEKLKDPAAIPALIAGYKRRGSDGQFLDAIIVIAHDPKTGDVAPAALPFLTALAGAQRLPKPASKIVDQSMRAIRAIRRIKTERVRKVLVAVCKYPARERYALRATVVACLALADRPGDDSFGALKTALQYAIKTRTPTLVAAVAQAMAKQGDRRALAPLARAMYQSARSFPSLREAIVAMGPPAVDKMLAIFRRKDPDIEKLASKTKLSGPHIKHQAALMLGDLYYAKAVPELLASVAEPGVHHEAVFIALTQIADPAAAKPLLAYARDAKRPKKSRVNAIGAYGVLAPGPAELPALLGWLRRETDPSLSNILALTCAQLVRDQAGLAKLKQALPKTHKVRAIALGVAAVGALCGNDSGCYLHAVESLPAQLHQRMAKLGLQLTAKRVATIKRFMDVRALTDVVKLRGKKADPLPVLLRLLETARGAVHQQVLYAIVHTAPRPCPKCLARFNHLLAKKTRQPAQVTQGLRMIRSYLTWAK